MPHRRSRVLPTLLAAVVLLVLPLVPAAGDAADDGHDCFGADALWGPASTCPETTSGPLTPTPAAAWDDRGDPYLRQADGDDCFASPPRFPLRRCAFGDREGAVTVAVVGNSHAGALVPTLQELARTRGWQVRSYLGSSCSPAPVDQDYGSATDDCRAWAERVAATVVTDHPDAVVLISRLSVPAVGAADREESLAVYRAGYRRVLHRWAAAGVQAVVLHDTPVQRTEEGALAAPECLLAHPGDYGACTTPRGPATPPDPAVLAAEDVRAPSVRPADLNDHLCRPTTCAAAVGGVTVYRDAGHLTVTFARTLAPFLEPHVTDALARRRVRPLRLAVADFGGAAADAAFLRSAQVIGVQNPPPRLRRHLGGAPSVHRARSASLPVATRGLYVERVAGRGPTVLRLDRDRRGWSVLDLDTTGARHPGRALTSALTLVRRERAAGRLVAVTGAFGGDLARAGRRFEAAGLSWTRRGRAGIAGPGRWSVTGVGTARPAGAPRRWLRLTLNP